MRSPLPPVASLRDFYAFEQHVATCRRQRGLDMVPQWYQVPVFYFSNSVCVIGDSDPVQAAVLAWQIGNLHFPIEVTESVIRSADDPAIRQLLQREQIAWRPAAAVFRPFKSAGHAHHH